MARILIEIALVWTGVVLGLQGLSYIPTVSTWLAPVLLFAAGVIPRLIHGHGFLKLLDPAKVLRDLGICGLALIPALLIGILTKRILLGLGLIPAPESSPLLVLVPQQFLLVAFPEEVLFRGYIQARLTTGLASQRWGVVVSMVVSSGLFALTHVVLQADPLAVLTFVPGLVMGWLYARTGRLIVPIVFHGMANLAWAMG